MDDLAKLFLQFDYPETKSLCKDFLTLVSATLVFSIAFSEKIIDFSHASRHTRQWLLSSWQCFIAAIIACGLGLCFLTLAAAAAAYGVGEIGPWSGGMYYWGGWAQLSLLLAGGLFVAGLTALIVVGARSLRERS